MKFEIKNREIKCDYNNSLQLIGDNADYTATFTFDEEWNGHIKTARFMQNGKCVEQILENDACEIPVELLKKGRLKVGVYTSEMVTTPCEVYIKESIKQENGTTPDPTPDVYAQIINMLENLDVEVSDEQIEKAINKYMAEHPIKTLTEEDVQRIVNEYVSEHKNELKGDKGDKGDTGGTGQDGKSAYEVAVANGYVGTEVEWLNSLKGDAGQNGADGKDGYTPEKGTDYWTAEDITEMQSYIDEKLINDVNNATFENLKTENKSIIGAINEINGDTITQDGVILNKIGNIIFVYLTSDIVLGSDGKTITTITNSDFIPKEQNVTTMTYCYNGEYTPCRILYDVDGNITVTDFKNLTISNLQVGFLQTRGFFFS